MTAAEEEFLRSLRATFKVEAAEHLQDIGAGLLELEKTAGTAEQRTLIETIFRAAHSLKGAARAVNFSEIESLCESLEELFSAWKRRDSLPTPTTLDTAHRTVDSMSRAMDAHSPPPAATTGGETETVRITVSSLDARLLEAEEMLSAKLAANQRAIDLSALAGRFEPWHKKWARVQPRTRVLGQTVEPGRDPSVAADLRGLAEFMEWNHDYLRALEANVAALRRTADQDRLLVGKLVDNLLENSKQLLMLPLGSLGGLLSKMVRDLCRDQGKDAELTVRGEEVTIDKRILEQLKDPLIHLLRNCIDHGIETPEQRSRVGKLPHAVISLTVSAVNSSQVEISVSDDGAGVDLEKVKAAAAKRGIMTLRTSDTVDQPAALALVFEADVSTSPMITQVSGRGLGLAIVREKVEKLGGRVAIDSRRGTGTTIRMSLPLTLATFRGILIESAQRSFVVPTAQVERVARFKSKELQSIEGRSTLAIDGRAVAVVDLAEVLHLPPARRKGGPPEATPILILGAGEQRVAFAVDAVLDEREVLVKSLTKPLSRVRNISGATVLGTGEVVPILNVPDLLRSATIAGALRTAAAVMPVVAPAKRILVVEDSITSRMLLKGILESAGYDVKTAVDGIDAFTSLRAERFDLVVSDVEMPRMDGFDLTARIRADPSLAEVPVVLVTALESRENRERGIDVGANAYLVKSSLDQSNLLDALRRLM
jgi:two-component system chemotaxis sensor kinase CheA